MPDAARETLEQLALETGAELAPLVAGDALGHRHRARLMVRGRRHSPKVGLFQAGSHRIVDIPRCHVHHPLINEAAAALKRAMRGCDADPYAEGPHRGLVRALQVVVERPSQTLQVVVVANAEDPERSSELLAALERELGSRLHSLWWNGNPTRSNTILGDRWQLVTGPEATRERIGGADVFFPPGAFGQSHLALADELVSAVHSEVEEGARVAEFYAGSGSIGLGLLARGHEVAFNEMGAGGLRGLELGLAEQPSARDRASVQPGPAGRALEMARGCGVAIVDPPRKGLDRALLEELSREPPKRLIYVACDLGELVADAQALLAAGVLGLRRLVPFALFPFTEHVETLAIFDRVPG